MEQEVDNQVLFLLPFSPSSRFTYYLVLIIVREHKAMEPSNRMVGKQQRRDTLSWYCNALHCNNTVITDAENKWQSLSTRNFPGGSVDTLYFEKRSCNDLC
jgi:hypothetical protein